MNIKIKFTKGERKILEHRLEVQDAMADGAIDQWPNLDHGERCAYIEKLVDKIFMNGTRGGLVAEINPNNKDHIFILDDVVNSSPLECIARDTLDWDLLSDPFSLEECKWARSTLRHIESIKKKLKEII
tara:strand:- start:79 stop:465 length:387 start_codon:yes stop_codon:yes gene_type:complete